MIEVVLSFILGFVVGIFVYRNNTKKLSNIADKVDALYDKIEEKSNK